MKTNIKRILFLLLFTGICSATLFAQENQSYILHTIEKGQSLYSIAAMYGISQDEIITINPGCNEKIYAGQSLRIPQNKQQNQNQEAFHTILQGETLYKLTTLYNISAKEICEANPGLTAENFRIGQVIRIPNSSEIDKSAIIAKQNIEQVSPSTSQNAAQSKCRDMHKVARKETIFSVSRMYVGVVVYDQ